jgi:hypothetical protein
VPGSRSNWFSAQRYSIVTFSPLDVAGFTQSPAERGQPMWLFMGERDAEEHDHRHRGLLRRVPRAATKPLRR